MTTLQEVLTNYQSGQNIFRRGAVTILVETIRNQREQIEQMQQGREPIDDQRTCQNCKHELMKAYQPPCRDCLSENPQDPHYKWEPQ